MNVTSHREYTSESSNSVRLSNTKPTFTENIYLNQKKKILEIMNANKYGHNEHIDPSDQNKYIIFNDPAETNKIDWKYAIFDTDQVFNEDFPMIKTQWEETDINQNSKGIEIRNLIFASNEELNLKTMRVENYFDIILKGESTFWLITRSSDVLNKFSAVIKISKEDRCQKVFASFGTFVFDAKDNMYFKVFLKQQLINYSKTKNKYYYDNDICELKGNILDCGDDRIRAKFFLNDSKIENTIDGDFFLPVYDKFKVMIAGAGQSTIVKAFYAKHLPKFEDEGKLTFSTEKRTCECCVMF
jgi:hypothetical protein